MKQNHYLNCVIAIFGYTLSMSMITFLITYIILQFSCLYSHDNKITLATPESSVFSNENHLNGGLFPDIVNSSLTVMGYEVDITHVPWKRGLIMTTDGRYDGILVASYTEERDKFFSFSDVVLEEECVFICLKENYSLLNESRKWEQYYIGSIRGSLISSILMAKELKVIEVLSHDQNIRKLLSGRIDIMAANRFTIQRLLKRNFPDRLNHFTLLEPAFHKGTLHFAVPDSHSNSAQIISDFNKGLKRIRENGVFESILARHEFQM